MEQKISTPKSKNWINPTAKGSPKIQTLMKNLTTFEKALIGSSTGAKGILGFYSGISVIIVGSTVSSAIYFGTCEFGKLFLSKFSKYPSVLIPPTAGAMGNIVSSAVMVPKELITQRMNLPVGVLSYSSFEYLKAAVLAKTKKGHLEPFESCATQVGRYLVTMMSTGVILATGFQLSAGPNTEAAVVSLGSSSALYARVSTGDLVLRLGAHQPSGNLTM
ncbi:hypothetical protein IFM89_007042 [Coptis chinensis]|uniref:Uncharacterized protein n=1 Tax=Coptis chinensis TaxID=261450 RepID=A0A835IMX0_9MAGN|nr:hypothetical protein IFM89_007042 [Coptis chinensis]